MARVSRLARPHTHTHTHTRAPHARDGTRVVTGPTHMHECPAWRAHTHMGRVMTGTRARTSVPLCAHTHTHTYTHTHVTGPTRMHECPAWRAHTHMGRVMTGTRACTSVPLCAHTHTRMHECPAWRAHTHMGAGHDRYTRTHKRPALRTHTHTHTHTRMRPHDPLRTYQQEWLRSGACSRGRGREGVVALAPPQGACPYATAPHTAGGAAQLWWGTVRAKRRAVHGALVSKPGSKTYPTLPRALGHSHTKNTGNPREGRPCNPTRNPIGGDSKQRHPIGAEGQEKPPTRVRIG